jgi:hypothetical protein
MSALGPDVSDVDFGLPQACSDAVTNYMHLSPTEVGVLRTRLERLTGPSHILAVRSMQVALNLAVEFQKDPDDVSDDEITPSQLSQVFAKLEADARLPTASPDRAGGRSVSQTSTIPGLAPPVPALDGTRPMAVDPVLKRSRSELPSTLPDEHFMDANDPVVHSDLEEMFRNFKKEIVSETSGLVSAMEHRVMDSTCNMLRTYDKGQCSKFDAVEINANALEARVVAHDSKLEQLQASIDVLSKGLVACSSATPQRHTVFSEDFDAAPSLSLLRLSVACNTTKVALQETVDSWLGENGALGPTDYFLAGPEFGKNFSIQFQGEEGLASRRANKAHMSLRGDRGVWRELYVTGPDATRFKIFVSEDKSRKQIRTETAGKRLFKSLQEVHPTLPSVLRRKEGMVSCNWLPVVKVLVTSADGPPTLQWVAKSVQSLSINKDAITAAFNAATGGTASVEWSL